MSKQLSVPVALNVFIRLDTLKLVFDSVKRVKPKVLFLIGDGPRNAVETDKSNIEACRKYVENIDWNCDVHRIYSVVNKGLYKTYFDAQAYIFERVDRCIFLEDDVLPSQSFFWFCEEMLDRYNNDLRVHYVTGLNYLGYYNKPDSDYFFSGEGSIWGYAIWKRTYLSQNMDYANSQYVTQCMCDVSDQLKPQYKKKIRGYINNPLYEGHVAGPEFYKNCLRFSQNQLYIVPKKNLISNIGVGDGSTHSAESLHLLARGVQRLFFARTYELDFPLAHPAFVVRDVFYEKQVNRILAWNHPIILIYRKVEATFRYLVFGNKKDLKGKIRSKLLKNIER